MALRLGRQESTDRVAFWYVNIRPEGVLSLSSLKLLPWNGNVAAPPLHYSIIGAGKRREWKLCKGQQRWMESFGRRGTGEQITRASRRASQQAASDTSPCQKESRSALIGLGNSSQAGKTQEGRGRQRNRSKLGSGPSCFRAESLTSRRVRIDRWQRGRASLDRSRKPWKPAQRVHWPQAATRRASCKFWRLVGPDLDQIRFLNGNGRGRATVGLAPGCVPGIFHGLRRVDSRALTAAESVPAEEQERWKNNAVARNR
ncbi:hypothetical protein VTN77DRAFT_3837 [Rasamsonia byssochlamydoides]|uniref:uncharacterized protein n=1 Tax=Rasamsonia byssochlamydoides TaxID=89139 RepID=UPI0037425572